MTGKENGERRAFPLDGDDGSNPGMTKREAFAMAAMQGLLFGSVGFIGNKEQVSAYAHGHCNEAVANRAVVMADVLLDELAKVQP